MASKEIMMKKFLVALLCMTMLGCGSVMAPSDFSVTPTQLTLHVGGPAGIITVHGAGIGAPTVIGGPPVLRVSVLGTSIVVSPIAVGNTTVTVIEGQHSQTVIVSVMN